MLQVSSKVVQVSSKIVNRENTCSTTSALSLSLNSPPYLPSKLKQKEKKRSTHQKRIGDNGGRGVCACGGGDNRDNGGSSVCMCVCVYVRMRGGIDGNDFSVSVSVSVAVSISVSVSVSRCVSLSLSRSRNDTLLLSLFPEKACASGEILKSQ